MPEERCPVIDEIVTGLELFAAQAEATLEAAHQDVATAEALMLEALKLAPETPVIKRTIIQLALREMLEKHACTGKRRWNTGQDLQTTPFHQKRLRARKL